jgi:ABC-type transport system involved in cytochrome bd biosynthesis fused ATPase/permease subunit
MKDLIKSVLICALIFIVVMFGGKILDFDSLIVFIVASLIVFLLIGYYGLKAIRNNKK